MAIDVGDPVSPFSSIGQSTPANPWGEIDSDADAEAAPNQSPQGTNADTVGSVPPDDNRIAEFLKAILDADIDKKEPAVATRLVYDLRLERQRVYGFAVDGEMAEVVIDNPDRLMAAPDGKHFIVCKDNSGHIVNTDWLHINIIPKDKTKSPFGF